MPWGVDASRISAWRGAVANVGGNWPMPNKSRVYLIEGADPRRQSYAHLLGAAGYEVTGFDSARAFIEIAPLVATGCILDLHGSGFDGHPQPGEISARRSDLPVIVMSADEGDV